MSTFSDYFKAQLINRPLSSIKSIGTGQIFQVSLIHLNFFGLQVITLEPAKSSNSRNYVVLEDHLEDLVASSARLRQPIEEVTLRDHAGKKIQIVLLMLTYFICCNYFSGNMRLTFCHRSLNHQFQS